MKFIAFSFSMNLMSEGKRYFITRLILNTFPVIVAAAFATEFFAKFTWVFRIGIGLLIIGLVVMGIIVAPDSLKGE